VGLDGDSIQTSLVSGVRCSRISTSISGVKVTFHPVGLRDLREVSVGAAIHVRHGDNVRAGRQALQDGRGRGAAGGEGQGIVGMLEGSDCGLEVVAVRDWRSDCTRTRRPACPQPGLRKGGREGDGLDHGAGDGIVRGSQHVLRACRIAVPATGLAAGSRLGVRGRSCR
jgi:hypothetical protein